MLLELFRKSSIYFGFTSVSKLVSLVILILIARLLQPQAFGTFSLFITVIALGTYFSDLGLNFSYQKYKNQLTLVDLLNVRLVVLPVLLSVLVFVAVWYQLFTPFQILLVSISIVCESMVNAFDGYYFSIKQPNIIAYRQYLKNFVLALPIFLPAVLQSLDAFLLAATIGSSISVLLFTPWKTLSDWSFTWMSVVSTARVTTTYAYLTILSFIYSKGDSFIIRFFLGEASLGFYSSAYRYLDGVSLLPTALAQNLFHITAHQDMKLSSLYKMMAVAVVIGIASMLVLFFAAEFLTVGLLGQAYLPAVPVLQVFAVVSFFYFINSPLSTVIQSSAQLSRFLPLASLNTLLNIGANLWVVSMYGITGVAYVMLLTEVTGFLINVWGTWQVFRQRRL